MKRLARSARRRTSGHPTRGTLSLLIPLLAVGYVEPFVVAFHQEFFFHDSPSRAPPSA